ncbi:PedC/BrcD family bacteriocin maturation disulfide isomerase [Lactiplantibacillus plantarum]|uniref:PedC/BrcD family bacteriocin maturation disulfide isomerase n=1 Tax=Lactiplantibacillus plantarum TaxID=1590 RepID=UPI000931EBA8|nr:PedC/BrcD family bacteriocin maturation disulfide isomerase [Lactiplantibacillus plantarum]MDN7044272.1 hypothetical protein [Lactiplantibacillus plantarum]
MEKKRILRIVISIMVAMIMFNSNYTAINAAGASEVENTQTARVNDEDITTVTKDQYYKNISGISELTGKQLLSIINSKEKYFLFLGFADCPYCREFSKVLNVFKLESKYPMYYVDLYGAYPDLTEDELSRVNSFLLNNIKFEGAPTFVKIQNGDILNSLIGTISLNDLEKINN